MNKADKLALTLATWFGCGLAPKGPGTMGALGGIAVALALHRFGGMPWWGLWILVLAGTPVGIWAADRTAVVKGLKDPQIVVIDEVLGQWIALAAAAPGNWLQIGLAFGLFRLFDIYKPWPVRQLEGLKGGTGIIADDLMAGVYGAAALALFRAVVQW
ncbi:MAG: phosphatidylglycerophosphatase A [Acidobacteria bacterium]|nr:phosphatidylglycerophosphatase A [Acidobacteriota bacterium]